MQREIALANQRLPDEWSRIEDIGAQCKYMDTAPAGSLKLAEKTSGYDHEIWTEALRNAA